MAIVYEAGNAGVLVSLGGLARYSRRGRKMDFHQVTFTAALNALILSSNPGRLAAIIVNAGVNPVNIGFGEAATALYGLPLAVGGSFQIDQNFPWIGAVTAYCTGSAIIAYAETSIE